MREEKNICLLFIDKNCPVLHICALQKYVNTYFKCWSVLHNTIEF